MIKLVFAVTSLGLAMIAFASHLPILGAICILAFLLGDYALSRPRSYRPLTMPKIACKKCGHFNRIDAARCERCNYSGSNLE